MNELMVDINDDSHQKFIWMVPLRESNQLALQTYGQPYCLEFGSDGKATLLLKSTRRGLCNYL